MNFGLSVLMVQILPLILLNLQIILGGCFFDYLESPIIFVVSEASLAKGCLLCCREALGANGALVISAFT
jgi:hypothetical protein